MRTLYLHAGMEKTGTTSLQQFLHTNSVELSCLGIWYPTDQNASYTEGWGHFPLAASLLECIPEFVSPGKSVLRDRCLQDFLADQTHRKEAVTIISAEHFSSRVSDEVSLRAFRTRLRAMYDRIVIVVYIRNQPSLATASYFTGVMNGRRDALIVDAITPADRYFNVRQMLDLWAETFGLENLIVREFNAQTLTGGDVCKDFCEIIGVDSSELTTTCRQNESLASAKIEAMRLINGQLPTFDENPDDWHRIQEIRSFFIAPFLVSESTDRVELNDDQRNEVLLKFELDNRAVNHRYLGGRLTQEWFPRHSEELQGVRRSDRENEDSADQLTASPEALVLASSIVAMAEKSRFQSIEEQLVQQQLENTQRQLENEQQRLENTRHQLENAQQQLESTQQQLYEIEATWLWKLRRELGKLAESIRTFVQIY